MSSLTIISGIPATYNVGAGRLMLHLANEAWTFGPSTELVYVGNKANAAASYRLGNHLGFMAAAALHFVRRGVARLHLRALATRSHVVLIHPQEIGIAWCQEFLRHRKRPTWIYILDASFFCIRSYNHLPGESAECLRCLRGEFVAAELNGCRAFPIADHRIMAFMNLLLEKVKTGKIRLLAQNERHAELMRAHFGQQAVIRIVGLWTVDMAEFDCHPAAEAQADSAYDVVFHAEPKDAKGFLWAIQLATACPELRFLFPCNLPEHLECPANCQFSPLTWELGLKGVIRHSPLTLAPSLWSAPIEGALVKSILNAPRVGVVAVATAYSSELPPTLVTQFDRNPVIAAGQLRERLAAPPNPRAAVTAWFEQLHGYARLLNGISNAISDTEEVEPGGCLRNAVASAAPNATKI